MRMASVLPYRDGYRAYVTIKGFPRQSKFCRTEAEARAWAAETEYQLKPKTTAYQKGKVGWTLRQAYEKYKDTDQKQKRWRTIRRESQVAVTVMERLGDYALANIDVALIQDFIDGRYKDTHGSDAKPYSASVVRMEKGLVSSIFNCALKRGLVAANPCLQARFSMQPVEIKVTRITEVQQAALFERARKLVYKKGQGKRMNASIIPWLEFIFATGMRPGEAARLELAWLNLTMKRPFCSIPPIGAKNKEPRILVIPTAILEGLQIQYLLAKSAGSPYLFWSVAPKTHKITPFAYYHPFKRLCEYEGITNVWPHSVRHEVVSRYFVETTLSDSVIAKIVGHRSTGSLAPYKNFRQEELRGTIEEFVDAQHKKISKIKPNQPKPREETDGWDIIKAALEK
jgi:integrase